MTRTRPGPQQGEQGGHRYPHSWPNRAGRQVTGFPKSALCQACDDGDPAAAALLAPLPPTSPHSPARGCTPSATAPPTRHTWPRKRPDGATANRDPPGRSPRAPVASCAWTPRTPRTPRTRSPPPAAACSTSAPGTSPG
ncbi:DUF6300 family protein [Kitasatospora brasiliensis]|uniref:DUF6300 family protein n=1 Tax=Kitasatospora brasiliensis TaxID=3058040 RepID=UPI003D78A069